MKCEWEDIKFSVLGVEYHNSFFYVECSDKFLKIKVDDRVSLKYFN